MTKLKTELTKASLKFQHTDKKRLIKGTVIALFIAFVPLMFQIYKSVPKVKVWNTFLFTYNSAHYTDANIAAWLLTGKIVPILLLLTWFFTCRHWWYHSIIIPIAMYIYQTMGILNDDHKYFEELNIVYLLPVMILVIPSIYLVRARIFNKLNTVSKSIQELEDELAFRPKTLWGKIKQFF